MIKGLRLRCSSVTYPFRYAPSYQPSGEQVLKRIDLVMEALPAAVKQAHERIIGERPVANDGKLLSLFDPDIYFIVRGKAGEKEVFSWLW